MVTPVTERLELTLHRLAEAGTSAELNLGERSGSVNQVAPEKV
jgi:hypothetical protein